MFRKIGQFSARFRYAIIALWVLAAILITLFAPNLSELGITDQSSYLPRDEPSVIADQVLAEHFPSQVSSSRAVLVIKSKEGSLHNGPGQAYLAELADYLLGNQAPASISEVLSPTDPNLAAQLISADGRVAMFAVGLRGSAQDTGTVEAMEAIQVRLDSAPAGLAGYVTGSVAIMEDYTSGVIESAGRTTIITIFLVIIILLVIYRSPVAPIIPLATIGIAFLISRGLIALLAGLGFAVSSITEVVLVVLLFGAGTDYCLFLISRFGEVLAEGATGPEGARRVVIHVGETISSSAATVIVGMGALSLADMKLFAMTGPSLALGVLITLLAGLTLAPALMAVLGKQVFWPKGARRPSEGGLWAKVAQVIAARPWLPVVVALVLLVPLAIYGQGMQRSFDLLADLPESMPSKAGFQVLSEAFGAGAMQPLDVVMTGMADARSPEGIAQIDALSRELLEMEGVADVRSLSLPAGKAQPEMRDALRLEGQLALVAGAIDDLRPQMTDVSLLADTDLAAAAAGLGALGGYLDEVAAAFPDLAQNANHQAAVESLSSLEGGLEETQKLLLVSNQLTQAAELTGAALDATALPAGGLIEMLGEAATQFDALRGYLEGVADAYPAVAEMEGYGQTLSALDALETTLDGVEESLLVSRQLELVAEGLSQVAAPLQDPAALAELADSPDQMAALGLLLSYLEELAGANPALAAQPEYQSALVHLTAGQALVEEAAQARLVSPQLALIATRMDETAAALKESPLALMPKAGEPGAAEQMSVLVTYLKELGEAYPSLAAIDDYETALTTAEQMGTQLKTIDLAKLGEQIAQAAKSLETLSAAFSGLSAVAAKTLPEATFIPEDLPSGALSLGPDLSPILDEITAAGEELATAAEFARREMPEATFVPTEIMAGAGSADLPFTNPLPAVSAAAQDLGQAMEQLAASVEAELPEATYMPPEDMLASQAGTFAEPLLAEMDRFQGAVVALAGDLKGQGDHFFIPTALAKSMGSASLLGSSSAGSTDWAGGLDQLLATYSTSDGSAARLQVILDSDPFGPEALNTAARLRDKVSAAGSGYVSGSTATNLDLQRVMGRDFTKIMILVLAGIAVVLVLLLRSLVAPIYMLLTILLSYGATLGITRLIFGEILGRGLTWFVPFLIFVLLVAIGMDYNIFIMGRIKEEVAGSDVRTGVKRAVQYTGGIIASAGVIMAATFAAMLSSSLQGLVQLALAIAIGVLLDAFVVVILVSAITALLGRWSWWPRRGPEG